MSGIRPLFLALGQPQRYRTSCVRVAGRVSQGLSPATPPARHLFHNDAQQDRSRNGDHEPGLGVPKVLKSHE